jgi:hypothetical protein
MSSSCTVRRARFSAGAVRVTSALGAFRATAFLGAERFGAAFLAGALRAGALRAACPALRRGAAFFFGAAGLELRRETFFGAAFRAAFLAVALRRFGA